MLIPARWPNRNEHGGYVGDTMERPWLKNYPPGVPAEIDPTKYSSLVELFKESFAKFRDRQAFICMGGVITYGELDDNSRALAAWLQSLSLIHISEPTR